MNRALYRVTLLIGALIYGGDLPASAQAPPDPVQESQRGPFEPLPPLPTLPEAPDDPIEFEDEPTATPEPEDVTPVSFFVETIQVEGNTIFQTEIDDLTGQLEGRDVTLEELLQLRTDITDLYISNGYISSGAFVPTNQDLDDGVVQIQVIEGSVDQIQINGLDHLRDSYVRDRVSLGTSSPLNVRRLEEALQLLQVNPLLATVDAELTAGSGPGENDLILDLVEANPFFANFGVDNARAPSIGSYQGSIGLSNANVLGFGDRLSAGYDITEGLNTYDVNYAFPVNGLDGTLSVGYETAESNIVDEQFRAAGIRSTSETLSFNFRQPLNRSLTNEFALSLGFDLRESRSFILDDIPFSFSVGPENGVSRVRAIRFGQEWVNRDINSVLAARSQFSIGLDMFNATVNDSGTDGRFFSWLGQFQWVEQFASNNLLITRINAQLTADSLLPLERFSIGGVDTVRGYAQNQLVTDNAITASTEFRFPVAEGLQLTPFVDAGGGWNNDTPDPDPAFLLGVGLGLRWQFEDALNVRLDYGIPLISPGDQGNSLQENGFYFSINLQPF
ncbi:ShlB/FhaC/HecB family hemolysin secretion/activation protein [Halomicronema sp. CCY15110]|uniref:ShlB/FhaC/HecB family hemolysin secretion/activation protein n=1 Tax=Halomicronema sp. CCY15110 TaxID=2767773 RepID=UPI001EF25A0A|nr:ShlB/FhaC/HecB family hemolysin secretion/activation protein [Halomicronema sp. CCY15110]